MCQTVAGISKINQFHELLLAQFLAGFCNLDPLWVGDAASAASEDSHNNEEVILLAVAY